MLPLFDDDMEPLTNIKWWEAGIFKIIRNNVQCTYYASSKARIFGSTGDTMFGAYYLEINYANLSKYQVCLNSGILELKVNSEYIDSWMRKTIPFQTSKY